MQALSGWDHGSIGSSSRVAWVSGSVRAKSGRTSLPLLTNRSTPGPDRRLVPSCGSSDQQRRGGEAAEARLDRVAEDLAEAEPIFQGLAVLVDRELAGLDRLFQGVEDRVEVAPAVEVAQDEAVEV